jgi:glycosyltransferase involved in cell wall biosynthesis
MGRLVREKGFGTLLEAAKRFKQNSNVFFVLAGVGPMYDEYKDYIDKNNLASTVFLTGYLQEEKKRALYQLAEIAVIPSHYEPFGIVALESLVFGKPSIVSNTGGLKGIVEHKKTGILTEPGDVENLVQEIQFLLDNEMEAKRIGESGRRLVEQLFSWNRIGDETKRVFDEVMMQNKMKENV